MAIYPFNLVNRRGIADIQAIGVNVTTTEVSFTFPNHAFWNSWYKGIVLIHLPAIPTGTTGTLPIQFETNGVSIPLTRSNGVAVTAEDILGNGVYLVYYDKTSNLLQLMSGII